MLEITINLKYLKKIYLKIYFMAKSKNVKIYFMRAFLYILCSYIINLLYINSLYNIIKNSVTILIYCI